MKNHTIKAYLHALQSRPLVMRAPKPLHDTVKRIEAKHGVTLAKEMV